MKQLVELLDMDLLRVLAGLPLVLGANTLLGAHLSKWEGEFRFNVLIDGVKKALIVYVSIILLVLVGHIIPELTLLFNGIEYTIPALLYYILHIKLMADIFEVVMKLMKVLKIKVEDLQPDYEPVIEMSDGEEE